jgi:triacylglycerol lipase
MGVLSPMPRLCVLFLVMKLLAGTGMAKPAATTPAGDTVVLLHGIGMRGWEMWRLESSLRREGYRVLNLTYPSRKLPLDELGRDWIPTQLRRHGVDEATRLHFVTHSMGGIVVRSWLHAAGAPANLGRVVMLAPPNHGSAAADRMKKSAAVRWYLGPNLSRLGTGPDSIPLALGPWPAPESKLGVIAGDRVINPLFSSWLGEANDGAVTVQSAQLEGMSDFIVLHHSHTVLTWRADTLRQVSAFLRNGVFEKPPPRNPLPDHVGGVPSPRFPKDG